MDADIRRERLRNALLSGLLLALLLLALWAGRWFPVVALSLEDIYFLPQPIDDRVIVVTMDNASFNRYGRSVAEWPRTLYADFIRQMSAAGARVVALDVLFFESTPDDEAVAAAIREARQSEAGTRVVLAAAASEPALPPPNPQNALYFRSGSLPLPLLRDSGAYAGFVNTLPDADSRLRRQPSLLVIEGTTHYSFAITTFLAYLRVPAGAFAQLVTPADRALFLTPQHVLPVDASGMWRQNYFEDTRHLPSVSLVDVLDGRVPPERFAGRVVLLGTTGDTGASDLYLVPSTVQNQPMSGVEIQMNAVATLLEGSALVDQPALSQAAIIVLLTLFSSLLYALPRWYLKLLLALLLLLGWFVAAIVWFLLRREVLHMLYVVLALALPLLLAIGLEISREVRLRGRSDFLRGGAQSLAGGRLKLETMLPLLAQHFQTILPGTGGGIWLAAPESDRPQRQYSWNISSAADLAALEDRARQPAPAALTAGTGYTDVPLTWQGAAVGRVLLAHPGRQMRRPQQRLAQAYADQIAPLLDSARLYETVARQHRLQEAILSASPAAIIIVDQNGLILRCNAAFEAITGQPRASLLQQPVFDFFTSVENQQQPLALRVNLSSTLPFRQEIYIEERSFYLDAAPLADTGGRVLILSDISRLMELNRLKTRMIRMASHDLKNPLGRIMGYAELMLMDGTLDETASKYLGQITASASEMNRIIHDILDLEQLRSTSATRDKLDFALLVLEVVMRYEPDTAIKNQLLNFDIPGEPMFTIGNYRQLTQAISNLVGNAVKYTPAEGRVMVSLAWRETTIYLQVIDNGPGIPAEELPKLFTEFYRVKTEATANIPGTGLGLSLVKSVIEAHQGRVGVTSQEGQGSTFYVELPGLPGGA